MPSKPRLAKAAPATPAADARTRDDLAVAWQTLDPPALPVVEFYGHKKTQTAGCFSNFHEHREIPFTVPDCCWDRLASTERHKGLPRTVQISFSEKSIMLCKAAAMGDRETYEKILSAATPGQAKKLGRQVTPFDENIWQSVILSVAFEAVYQKFHGLQRHSAECRTLLRTGDALIVEAAPSDAVWGIGRPVGHPSCQDPRQWGDGNVLGWALMKSRRALREEQCEEHGQDNIE